MCSRAQLVPLRGPTASGGRYRILKSEKLGEGCYGAVVKATDLITGAMRAWKTVKTSKGDLANSRLEFKIMASMDHPSIIRLYEVVADSKRFCFVMELCEGGDLMNKLAEVGPEFRFPESVSAPVIRQLLCAVHYMQERLITHSDLGSRNVLLVRPGSLEGNKVKIADFGSAKIFDPEKGPQKGDIWSLGLMMRTLVCSSGLSGGKSASSASPSKAGLAPKATEKPSRPSSSPQPKAAAGARVPSEASTMSSTAEAAAPTK
ncbi:unnamed protein product, partial [Polarella glacialis]